MLSITLSNCWLYLLPATVSVVVLIILYHRGWTRRYPAFSIYLCVDTLLSAIFIPFAAWYSHLPVSAPSKFPAYRVYYYSFWSSTAVEVVIIFIVIYRIFSVAFSRYSTLRRWTPVLYMAALAVCLVLAIFVLPPTIKARGVLSIFIPLWQASMFFRVGILAVLFLIVFGIGIPLREYLFGIAAGLGLDAAIKLSTTIAATRWPSLRVYVYLDQMGDIVANAIWFVYLFVPRRVPQFSGDMITGMEVERWKEALSGFLHKRAL